MKLALLLLVIVSSLADPQERPGADHESLVAERKKQIGEQKKNQQTAVEKARANVLAEPNSAEGHFQLADALSKGTITRNISEEIERAYSTAIQLKPDYAEAFLGLATIRGIWSKGEGQLEALERAILLKPDYAEAYCNLGFFHLGRIIGKEPGVDIKGQAKLAAGTFTIALGIKSDLGEALMGLGVSNEYLGKYSESVEAFKKALLLNPSDFLSHAMFGGVYVELGDKQAAAEEYDALLQLGKKLDLELEAMGNSEAPNLAKAYADHLLKEIQMRFKK